MMDKIYLHFQGLNLLCEFIKKFAGGDDNQVHAWFFFLCRNSAYFKTFRMIQNFSAEKDQQGFRVEEVTLHQVGQVKGKLFRRHMSAIWTIISIAEVAIVHAKLRGLKKNPIYWIRLISFHYKAQAWPAIGSICFSIPTSFSRLPSLPNTSTLFHNSFLAVSKSIPGAIWAK